MVIYFDTPQIKVNYVEEKSEKKIITINSSLTLPVFNHSGWIIFSSTYIRTRAEEKFFFSFLFLNCCSSWKFISIRSSIFMEQEVPSLFHLIVLDDHLYISGAIVVLLAKTFYLVLFSNDLKIMTNQLVRHPWSSL